MKTHHKSLFILALSTLFACNSNNKQVVPLNKVEPEITHLNKGIQKNDTAPNNFHVAISYPQWQSPNKAGKNANTQIAKHIQYYIQSNNQDSIHQTLEESVIYFKNEYDSLTAEFPESHLSYEFLSDANISSNTNKYISIKFDLYKFTGGAHGMQWTTFLNLDTQTGKSLPIDSLVSNKETLAKALENALRKKYDMSADDNWENFGFFIHDFQWPSQIGFTQDSIKAIYNPYEIRCYADGIICITLPVAPFLK